MIVLESHDSSESSWVKWAQFSSERASDNESPKAVAFRHSPGLLPQLQGQGLAILKQRLAFKNVSSLLRKNDVSAMLPTAQW